MSGQLERYRTSATGRYRQHGTPEEPNLEMWRVPSASLHKPVSPSGLRCACRMEGCEGVAGALEERRQWLTQAAEQAEKDRALAESQVQAAKKSLASDNDIRVGSREVRCSLSPLAQHSMPCSHSCAQDQCRSRGSTPHPQAQLQIPGCSSVQLNRCVCWKRSQRRHARMLTAAHGGSCACRGEGWMLTREFVFH